MTIAQVLQALPTCLLLAVVAAPVHAQEPEAGLPSAAQGAPMPAPPATVARGAAGEITIRAVRLEQPLAFDGALDDGIYQRVPPATDFIQQFPVSGDGATEDTEVWVFFDDEHVYIALRCWDSRPDQMVANEMRRDNRNIWLNDNVIVTLDTFFDRRSGFFFQTNPLGGVRDALIVDESTVNYDWNTVWDVRSRRGEDGWTTEMAIPFKSLRYVPTESQTWGFNVMRVVRSKNEQTLFSPVPSTYRANGGMRMASAATLVGIDAPPGSRNIEVKPYGISTLTTNLPADISNETDADFGVDAKYGITSSMTFDLTYNTDFAQVEIDEQQVNLTRFSLFFPEKRDFFLEGQGVFDFAGSGAGQARGPDPAPLMFFSRRVGLNGSTPVPIKLGGRLMGRAGPLSMGVLDIQTDDGVGAGAPATNFGVVRIKADVLELSNVGVIFTNRSPALPGSGTNRVYGADANLAFFENLRINGFYAHSSTPGLTGDANTYRAQLQYEADRYGIGFERLKVGNAFNPESGFLRRPDFRLTSGQARFSPRLDDNRYIRQLSWSASFDRYVNSTDVLESRQEGASFRTDFHSSDAASVDYSRSYEFLTEPFEVEDDVVVPAGGYRFHEVSAGLTLGPHRMFSGGLNVSHGGFYTGHRTQAGYSGRVQFSSQFAVEPRFSMDWVDLPEGEFRVTLVGARPTLTITPRMFVSALMQYNSSSGALETNVRWRWEFEPGSDVFVVYTDGRRDADDRFPDLVNRGLAVKFTRFFRF